MSNLLRKSSNYLVQSLIKEVEHMRTYGIPVATLANKYHVTSRIIRDLADDLEGMEVREYDDVGYVCKQRGTKVQEATP